MVTALVGAHDVGFEALGHLDRRRCILGLADDVEAFLAPRIVHAGDVEKADKAARAVVAEEVRKLADGSARARLLARFAALLLLVAAAGNTALQSVMPAIGRAMDVRAAGDEPVFVRFADVAMYTAKRHRSQVEVQAMSEA